MSFEVNLLKNGFKLVNIFFLRRAALAEELALLKQVDQLSLNGLSPLRGKYGHSRYTLFYHVQNILVLFLFLYSDYFIFDFPMFRLSSMSPNARLARITTLENMLSISSNALVAMASQLSEAEERERAFTGRGRWNQLRSLGDAKNLLQFMFTAAADAKYSSCHSVYVDNQYLFSKKFNWIYKCIINRCQLWEKEMEIKEMKEQLNELVILLRQSEAKRKEIVKEQKMKEQAVAIALATSGSVRLNFLLVFHIMTIPSGWITFCPLFSYVHMEQHSFTCKEI